MSNVKVELDLGGLNDLMKSPEIKACLEKAGAAVAKTASSMAGGAAFDHSVHEANFVAIDNVYPADAQAAKANFQDNTLLKAVGAVGLPTHK